MLVVRENEYQKSSHFFSAKIPLVQKTSLIVDIVVKYYMKAQIYYPTKNHKN